MRPPRSTRILALALAALLALPCAAGADPVIVPSPSSQDAPAPKPSGQAQDPDPEAPTNSPEPRPSESGSAQDIEPPEEDDREPTPSVSGDEPADASDSDNGSQSDAATGRKGKGDTQADQLFGTSPLCDAKSNGMKLEAGGAAQRNCRWSGSIAQPHPIANYGLDQHVEADLTDTDTVIPSVLGAICQLIWAGLLYALRGVLLIVELAFSNDLVNAAMGSIKQGLARLNDVFGTKSWHLAAISMLGLWGIWTGFVRRKTIQTFSGLAAAVGLMIVVQVIMIRPEATVGQAAKLSSEGALVALSGASTGTVDRPADSFGKATQQLFDTLVVRPWCALQFTSVEGCLKIQTAKGQPKLSIADVWLSYPANSEERDTLYKHLDGEPFDMKIRKDECRNTGVAKWIDDIAADDSAWAAWSGFVSWGCSEIMGNESEREIALKYDDDKAGVHTDASIQSQDGVFTRLALLGMIALGLIAAIAVLLWIGIRLLLAGLFSLVLILFAPIVFLMAAFGESGREAVIAYLKKLFGLIAAKFIFATLLAVVVLAEGVINGLKLSWFPLWMLHLAFWWGLLLKRDELLGFLLLDRRTVENAGSMVGGNGSASMSSLYYGWQMARSGLRAAMTPARMAIDAGRDHAAQSAAGALDHAAEMEDQRAEAAEESENLDLQHRTAETSAIREHDHGTLGEEAQTARDIKRGQETSRAREILRKRKKTEERLKANRERQAELDEKLNGPGRLSPGTRRDRAEAELQRLQAQEPTLAKQVDSWHSNPDRVAEGRWATDTLRHAQDAPREMGRREVDDYIAQRREDIAKLPADHERNLTAAGINPTTYRRASASEQQRMRRQSEQAMERSRRLIDSASGSGVMSRDELDRRWQRVGSDPSGLRATVRSGEELRNVRRVDAERESQRRRDDSRRNRDADRDRRARRHEEDIHARARRRVR